MEKIISLFQRNYGTDRLVRNEVVSGAEWVLAGEGMATRKFDGTCCLVKDGVLWKRFDAKRGKKPPDGFVPAQDPDPQTGHWPGWVPVGDGPEDRWHREAWTSAIDAYGGPREDGTYELCGPKVQGNPEGFDHHALVCHGVDELSDAPRTFDALRAYFADTVEIEGIVWHHPDGRMVKIKGKDFGIRRGKKEA